MAKHIRRDSREKSASTSLEREPNYDPLADTVVPSLTDSVHIALGRHHVEQAVQRELLSHPGLHFKSLVVRRTKNGVCLEGYLEADENGPDVTHIARTVAGVNEVINRLLIKRLEAAKI